MRVRVPPRAPIKNRKKISSFGFFIKLKLRIEVYSFLIFKRLQACWTPYLFLFLELRVRLISETCMK